MEEGHGDDLVKREDEQSVEQRDHSDVENVDEESSHDNSVVNQNEDSGNNNAWPLTHLDINSRSPLHNQIVLQKIQKMILVEKQQPIPLTSIEDYDHRAASLNYIESTAYSEKLQILTKRASLYRKPAKPSKYISEPDFLKTYKYYVDRLLSKNY